MTDEDESSIQTLSTQMTDEDGSSILVKLWDVGNGIPKSSTLFEVTDANVTRFSPDGQFLAVGRIEEDIIELWNLEDGKNSQQFPHFPGNLSSLHFSPTSDILMATFKESDHICVWRLDAREMVFFSIDIGDIPSAIIRAPLTSHLFIPRLDTVEIWEASMTSSLMIFEIKLPSLIKSICLSHDGYRILVGGEDGIVRMWDMNLARKQLVTMDTQDDLRVIAFSHSGKMAATRSEGSVEFRNTTTPKVVRHMDHQSHMDTAFSPGENRVAVLSDSLVTIGNINNPENCLSFDPWPTGRRVVDGRVAFQTNNHVVICAKLLRDDDDGVSDRTCGLLQVWYVPGPTCLFSLDFEITRDWRKYVTGPFSLDFETLKYSSIRLAPDGLTVVIVGLSTVLCYSWNHDTAQFHPFHFNNQRHLYGYSHVYSPDGELFACCSRKDRHVRVWDTRTGQLCGNPITMSNGVSTIALSPALNDRSLGNRLIAVSCRNTNTTSLFDVYTGHLYAQFWSHSCGMTFIRDGTKLMTSPRPLIIRDTADLTVKHRDKYELILRGMKDGWMIGQDNESLFWVPVEHRENLCPLPQFETIWGRSTSLDLSDFRCGNKWMECIDIKWLKKLKNKEKKMGRLFG